MSPPGIETRSLDNVPIGLAQHARGVVREGISNGVRWANARDLTVSVSPDDHLTTAITDDGDAIVEAAGRSGPHSLPQRAHEANGNCLLTRVDAGGTRLTWTAPLH